MSSHSPPLVPSGCPSMIPTHSSCWSGLLLATLLFSGSIWSLECRGCRGWWRRGGMRRHMLSCESSPSSGICLFLGGYCIKATLHISFGWSFEWICRSGHGGKRERDEMQTETHRDSDPWPRWHHPRVLTQKGTEILCNISVLGHFNHCHIPEKLIIIYRRKWEVELMKICSDFIITKLS